MKIAYVYDCIYPYIVGGVQQRIWEMSKRLVQRGHKVTVFGMKLWEGEDIFYKEGVRLWGASAAKELYINSRRSTIQAIYFALKIAPVLLREKFDLIDCQNFPYFPGFSAKLHSLLRKSHLIVTWHEFWGDYWYEYLGRRGIFGKVVEQAEMHLADRVVAVSESVKRDLEQHGCREVRVIPNGIDFEEISKIPAAPEYSDIVFAGRLIKEKNVDLLIEAIGYIKQNQPNIRCFVIGDGPERGNLEGLIETLHLKDNVFMKGFIENQDKVFSYFKSSKVFVSPSMREGFGIVALEANACGLPIVTVKHSRNAICDLITEGETGFICEPTIQDLTDKLLIAKNRDRNGKWGVRCIEFARNYDWDIIVSMVEDAYKVE
jgi:glycosyltransferase involved in cell wall biosynthesis